jgi:hypothetical protein
MSGAELAPEFIAIALPKVSLDVREGQAVNQIERFLTDVALSVQYCLGVRG